MKGVRENNKKNYEIINEMKTLRQGDSVKDAERQENFLINVVNAFNLRFVTTVVYLTKDLERFAYIVVQNLCVKLKIVMR